MWVEMWVEAIDATPAKVLPGGLIPFPLRFDIVVGKHCGNSHSNTREVCMAHWFAVAWVLCGAVAYVWGVAYKLAMRQRIPSEDVFPGFLLIFMAGPILLLMVFHDWRSDRQNQNSN